MMLGEIDNVRPTGADVARAMQAFGVLPGAWSAPNMAHMQAGTCHIKHRQAYCALPGAWSRSALLAACSAVTSKAARAGWLTELRKKSRSVISHARKERMRYAVGLRTCQLWVPRDKLGKGAGFFLERHVNRRRFAL